MAEFPKFDYKYLKEAFKEPLNFWGLASFAAVAAFSQDVTVLAGGPGRRNSLLSNRASQLILSPPR